MRWPDGEPHWIATEITIRIKSLSVIFGYLDGRLWLSSCWYLRCFRFFFCVLSSLFGRQHSPPLTLWIGHILSLSISAGYGEMAGTYIHMCRTLLSFSCWIYTLWSESFTWMGYMRCVWCFFFFFFFVRFYLLFDFANTQRINVFDVWNFVRFGSSSITHTVNVRAQGSGHCTIYRFSWVWYTINADSFAEYLSPGFKFGEKKTIIKIDYWLIVSAFLFMPFFFAKFILIRYFFRWIATSLISLISNSRFNWI